MPRIALLGGGFSMDPDRPAAGRLGARGWCPHACPHYDFRTRAAAVVPARGGRRDLPSGWALDDGAAALFIDGVLGESAARRPGAHLGRVQAEPGGGVAETAAEARLLR